MAKFYFTFGCGIDNPHRNCFKVIEADTELEARDIMVAEYGINWAFCYDENGWNIIKKDDPKYLERCRFYGVPANGKSYNQQEVYKLKQL